MTSRFVSLRYKFMFALTIVPLVALFIFLQVAIDIFENDKIAYVFDSLLSSSKSIASQVQNELGGKKLLAQTLALTVNTESHTISDSGQFLFESDPRVLWFSLYRKSEVAAQLKFESIAQASQKTFDPAGFKIEIENLIAQMGKDTTYFQPIDSDKAILLVRIGEAASKDTTVATLLITTHDLITLFSSSGVRGSYLLNTNGDILFPHGGNEKIENHAFNALKERGFRDGTMEVSESSGDRKQRPLLISLSSVGISDLHVVSLIEKDQALTAITSLIRKAALFFLGLAITTLMISVLASRGLTNSLGELLFSTKAISEGTFDIELKVQSNDEVGILATSFNKMAKEVARLILATKEKARMEAELSTAQTVQRTLFPPAHAKLGSCEISGFYEPASECGGDWWHYFEDENHVYICIGDVTGHGAPAALLTSAARAASSVIRHTSNLTAKSFLTLLNQALFETAHGEMMMTFFFTKIDKQTGLMTYANASHEPAMLLRNDVKVVSKDSFEHLQDSRAPRLGEAMAIKIEEVEIQLRAGDQILFYTDGAYDIRNAEGREYGMRRFSKMLASALERRDETKNTLENIVQNMNEWKLDSPLNDDVTLIVMKYNGRQVLRKID
jgi:sigma-B regulation protein RsbU (phosphoserine phosphatase)